MEWGALTVTMNKDAHWNDGEKLTAADVAYTFNLAKNMLFNGKVTGII